MAKKNPQRFVVRLRQGGRIKGTIGPFDSQEEAKEQAQPFADAAAPGVKVYVEPLARRSADSAGTHTKWVHGRETTPRLRPYANPRGRKKNPAMSKRDAMGWMNKLQAKHGRTATYYKLIRAAVENRTIPPSAVVGGGYKNGRKVALKWLDDAIANPEEKSNPRRKNAAKAKFAVGDRVNYTTQFLKSTGLSARQVQKGGTITALGDINGKPAKPGAWVYATVQWPSGEIAKINVFNLKKLPAKKNPLVVSEATKYATWTPPDYPPWVRTKYGDKPRRVPIVVENTEGTDYRGFRTWGHIIALPGDNMAIFRPKDEFTNIHPRKGNPRGAGCFVCFTEDGKRWYAEAKKATDAKKLVTWFKHLGKKHVAVTKRPPKDGVLLPHVPPIGQIDKMIAADKRR